MTEPRSNYYYLPFPPNERFFGRQDELQQMGSYLLPPEQQAPISAPKCVVLTGLGGVGKSALAREYVTRSRNRKDYDCICWISCLLKEELEESFRRISIELGLQEAASSVAELSWHLVTAYLKERRWRSLFIFDGLEDVNILGFIRRTDGPNCAIIITTRRPSLESCGPGLAVDCLSDPDGALLLQFLTGRERSETDENDAALAISKLLGGLPLALNQIASFMRTKQLTFTEYLEHYTSFRYPGTSLKYQTFGKLRLDPYGPTSSGLWLTTVKRLSKDAFRLMGVLSVLDPDSIHRGILEGSRFSSLQNVASSIDELRDASLILVESDELKVHRLVQRMFWDHAGSKVLLSAVDIAAKYVLTSIEIQPPRNAGTFGFERHVYCLLKVPIRGNLASLSTLRQWMTDEGTRAIQSDTDDEDETSSIFSVSSGGSSTSSLQAPVHQDAVHQLVEAFKEDPDMLSTISGVQDVDSNNDFQNDFADFLNIFAERLSLEARLPIESEAAMWIVRHRREISQYMCSPRENGTEKFIEPLTSLRPELPKGALIEKYLQSARRSETEAPFHSAEPCALGQEEALQVEEGTPGLSSVPPAIPSFQLQKSLQEFILESASFTGLKTDLYNLFLIRARKDREKSPRPIWRHRCTRLVVALEVRFHDAIQHVRREQNGLLKTVVLGVLRLNSFVFRVAHDALSSDMRLARGARLLQGTQRGWVCYDMGLGKICAGWKCGCGKTVFDDFIEVKKGAVQAAMKELASRNPAPTPTSFTSAAPGINHNLKDRAAAGYNILRKAMSGWWKKTRAKAEMKASSSARLPDSLSQRHLLLCISQWRGYFKTGMIPVSLDLESDEDLFRKLKEEYARMVGSWRRLLSLRCLESIKFVQFNVTYHQFIDILKDSAAHDGAEKSLPPPGHPDYTYSPVPITMIPPVGHRTMLHCYQCPQSVRGKNFCLTRFPGHHRDNVVLPNGADETIAWGIELVEGRDYTFLFVLGAVILLSSILFGVCWSVFRNDIQGGFTVAGYATSTLACFVGTIQYAFERR